MLATFKALIVDDWRDAWKWATNWLGIFLAAWGALPEGTQNSILSGFLPASKVPMYAGILLIVLRLWSQRIAASAGAPAAEPKP